MWAVFVTKELWKRGVWYVSCQPAHTPVPDIYVFRNDAKPVSIVTSGCFHPVTKVQSASIHLFLGDDEDEGE
jgi:protein SDA1